MSKRRYTLLRAVAELVNAANGVQPIAREGYPTIAGVRVRLADVGDVAGVHGGSMLDALRRGLRGDFRGCRGRIALVLTAIAWALLCLIHRRNVASEPHFEEPLREALGDDYEQSPPSRSLRGVARRSASGPTTWSAGATSRKPTPCNTVRTAG